MHKLDGNTKRAEVIIEDTLKNGGVIFVDGKSSHPNYLKSAYELSRECHISTRNRVRKIRLFKNK